HLVLAPRGCETLGHTMGESASRSWARPAVLLGVWYAVVGITFAMPVTNVQMWRRAAWVVSAIGYVAHIAYKRFRRQESPARAAWHVASGVALSAFGRRVVGASHSPLHG